MTTLAGRVRLSLGQLRWKLTASYTAVTVAALLVVFLALVSAAVFYWRTNSAATPSLLLHDLEAGYAPLVRPYLAEQPPDIDSLAAFLARFDHNLVTPSSIRIGNLQLSVNVGDVAAVIFFGSDGRVITSLPHSFVAQGVDLTGVADAQLSGLAGPARYALAGVRNERRLLKQLPDRSWAGAFPVFAAEKSVRIVGAVAFLTHPALWSSEDLLKQIGLILLFVTFLAAVMGTLFGSMTARGLDHRLQAITTAIAGWSQGEFSLGVRDSAGDELASLADDLNHMASQLAHLVDRRQEMSAIEERNRLARDLHDSAKQQAFAASAQLAAARTLLPADRAAALLHIQEAEVLVDQVRHELTELIRELRPALLQEIGLVPAVREYARDWAELNRCELDFALGGDGSIIAPDIQEALFRVAQEALSNVARHSNATRVVLAINLDPEQVSLSVRDNGCGFSASRTNVGVGLNSMRERAELVGGCLSVVSTSDAGTTIEMTVPTRPAGGNS